MKTHSAVIPASVIFLILAVPLILPGAAQRESQRGGPPHTFERLPANTPRANQGRIPPPPPARSNPREAREIERLPTGHINDTPHVNNNRWYGHEQPGDARFHLDRPFQYGRFERFGPSYRYTVVNIDPNLHRFWLPGGFYFDVAPGDWPLAADWCWNCGDDFVVYEDADHPGWYLLYNVHTGMYVHCQYLGT